MSYKQATAPFFHLPSFFDKLASSKMRSVQ